jgi:hypothetical protein
MALTVQLLMRSMIQVPAEERESPREDACPRLLKGCAQHGAPREPKTGRFASGNDASWEPPATTRSRRTLLTRVLRTGRFPSAAVELASKECAATPIGTSPGNSGFTIHGKEGRKANRPGFLAVALLTTLAMTLAACGSADGDGNSAEQSPTETVSSPEASTGVVDPTLERPDNLNSVQQFVFDGMASNLQEAADKLERGEDPTFSCTSVLAYAEGDATTGLEEAAQKAREQCGREIPIAWATLQLDTVEATGNVAESIGECASAIVSLDIAQARFTDSRVSELRTRADQICA